MPLIKSVPHLPKRWRLILGGIILLLGGYGFLRWFSHQMLYPAPLTRVTQPPPDFSPVTIGEAEGWLYEPSQPSPTSPVILYCHGNGENLKTMEQAGMLNMLSEMGSPVLVFDYPGYGNSRGSPSEPALVDTASAFLEHLDQRYPRRPKILWGHSLGAGVAVQTTARHPNLVRGLILMSPFDTMHAVASRYAPRWVTHHLLPDRYDSLGASAAIACPTLILHGEEDWIIPISHGRTLASAFGARARWTAIPKRGHNDILSDRTAIEKTRAFLRIFSTVPSTAPHSFSIISPYVHRGGRG